MRIEPKQIFFQSKNQAFIEVDSIEMAREMAQYYLLNPPCIRQRTIHLQFSNHKQLSPPSSALQEVCHASFKIRNSNCSEIIDGPS